jgi:signal peptidase I
MMLRILATTLLLFSLIGCEEEINPDDYKTESTGLRGEVLVFMDDFYWKKEPGQITQQYFEKFLYGTPQLETQLSVRNYPLKNFNRNHKVNRNILLVKFDKELTSLTYDILKDKWAKNQLYIEIKTPNIEEYEVFMLNRGEVLANLFLTEERERLQSHFSKRKSEPAVKQIQSKHQLKITFPKDFRVSENKKDFVWATYERMVTRQGRTFDMQQGFFIYHYPYTSDSTFYTQKLIEKRNEVLQQHVKGDTDDVYMTTQMMKNFEPKADTVNLNGKFAILMRGQYRMENDFGFGGPFISLTTLDEKRNRVVTIEGYVFAPNSPKRELIRDLEAILYSLEF